MRRVLAGRAGPEPQGLDGERELAGVAALNAQRSLRATRALTSGAVLLVQDEHPRAAFGQGGGGRDAGDAAADHDDVGSPDQRHVSPSYRRRASRARIWTSSTVTPRPRPVGTAIDESTTSICSTVTCSRYFSGPIR